MLFEPYLRFHIFSLVRVTEWEIAAYDFLVLVPKCHSTPRIVEREREFLSGCTIS